MQISKLRREVSSALRAFAWDQWAQMGVFARRQAHDRWAMDPEALLLLTLEAARDEPRLFDEVLDWLLVNERMISVRRLRNLSRDDDDRALVEAALGWVARRRPRARLTARTPIEGSARAGPRPLFRGEEVGVEQADEAFLEQGLLKPRVEPRGRSQAPDLSTPVNFAFRMRHVVGVGARAEVLRVLLCSDAPGLTAQVVADSAAYAKRNVQEALSSLSAAWVIDAVSVANEQRYAARRERWGPLLGLAPTEFPINRDWPQLLHALRRVLRWLDEPGREELSDYMKASEARVLMEEIGSELLYAGVPARPGLAQGADYWEAFVAVTRAAIHLVSSSTAGYAES